MGAPAGREQETWPGWEPGWEGHNLMQLRQGARMSLADKLTWLEEAEQFVRAMARERLKRGLPIVSDRDLSWIAETPEELALIRRV